MSGLIARVICAFALCFVFSQAAEFTQQYLQRLGGAADALRESVGQFDASAGASKLRREQALAKLRDNPDAFVATQGKVAAATIARYDSTNRRYIGLTSAAPLLRPFVALADPDWAIVKRTGEDFRPALPVTIDGVVLTVTGFVLGWAGGAGAHGAARMARRRRRTDDADKAKA